jgi:FkbM family methyltransferase
MDLEEGFTMQKFKNLLKRFYPPPVQAFMREVNNILFSITNSKKELRAQIDEVQKETSSLYKTISAQNDELKRLYSLFESANRENLRIFLESKKEREQMQEIIKTISENIDKLIVRVPERHLYNNDYERRVTTSFKEYRQRHDYPEKLRALLNGLDDESAMTVVRILNRQEKIWGSEGKAIDILTDEEQRQIRYIRQHFHNNILKIADDIFCYKHYLLPINHFEPCVFVDRYALDTLNNTKYFRDKSIVDVGAFIGDTSLILSPLTSSKLYAFEATTKYYNLLQKTIELNNIENVVPINAALGAECGKISINIAGSSSSILKPNIEPEGSEEVEMLTLDSFVDKNCLEVGLIKVDIEGYEREFLKGAEKTIRSQRPTLLISIYHDASDFFEIKPILESWGLGYSFKIHKPVDYSISREVILIAEI